MGTFTPVCKGSGQWRSRDFRLGAHGECGRAIMYGVYVAPDGVQGQRSRLGVRSEAGDIRYSTTKVSAYIQSLKRIFCKVKLLTNWS